MKLTFIAAYLLIPFVSYNFIPDTLHSQLNLNHALLLCQGDKREQN